MSVLYVALPIAIALGATAMWACIRSIRSGQFDDLESPAIRMLIDDHPQSTDGRQTADVDAPNQPPS